MNNDDNVECVLCSMGNLVYEFSLVCVYSVWCGLIITQRVGSYMHVS
jgi:hypothetical protein